MRVTDHPTHKRIQCAHLTLLRYTDEFSELCMRWFRALHVIPLNQSSYLQTHHGELLCVVHSTVKLVHHVLMHCSPHAHESLSGAQRQPASIALQFRNPAQPLSTASRHLAQVWHWIAQRMAGRPHLPQAILVLISNYVDMSSSMLL